MQQAALIIFIRNPKPGQGKTRLARSVGVGKAHEIYLTLLKRTYDLSCSYPGPRYLFYSDFIDHDDQWNSELFHKRLQSQGDLGWKMKEAFEEVLREHDRVIIIGSDCPAMELSDLLQAATVLEDNDLVIGPSQDGGYYLLGMKELYPDLFENIPWSSPATYNETVEAADELNLSISNLRTLNDIDTEADWEEWLTS